MGLEAVRSLAPKGIILSGGRARVYERNAPFCDPRLLEMGIPILGICYGMQLIGKLLGGEVTHSEKREYGKAKLMMDRGGRLFSGLGKRGSSFIVWMSMEIRSGHFPLDFKASPT